MRNLTFEQGGLTWEATWTPAGIMVSTVIPGTEVEQRPRRRRRHKPGVEGDRNGAAKLSTAQVRVIRKMRKAVSTPQWQFEKQMAQTYKVTPACISHVITGRTWKHVK